MTVPNKNFEQESERTYLGCMFLRDDCMEINIDKRVSVGNKILHAMNKLTVNVNLYITDCFAVECVEVKCRSIKLY